MPHVLTCDHCRAKLRTHAEVPIGRSIRCPKCSRLFVIGEHNQADASVGTKTPPPAPAWEVVEDEPPVAKGRSATAAAEVPARKRSARPAPRGDDRDEEARPGPRRRARADAAGRPTRRRWLLVGAAAGLVLLLAAGAGAALLLRGGRLGPGPADEPVATRLQREIRKDLFTYCPTTDYAITYTDFTAPREPDEQRNVTLGDEATKFGVPADLVTHSLYLTNFGRSGVSYTIRVFALRGPFDLAAAAGDRFEAVPVAGGPVFRGKQNPEHQAFQPRPDLVVVLSKQFAYDKDTKLAEELIRRPPTEDKLPPGLWEVMREVSGYPTIAAGVGRAGDQLIPVVDRFHATGTTYFPTRSESLACVTYASPDDARRARKASDDLDAKIAQDFPDLKPGPDRETRRWVKGERLYTYRNHAKVGPKK